MSAVRIIPILLVLGALALFTLQNISPALPLVILGSTTQALPLAAWIGGAIAAGAFTTLLISGLTPQSRPAMRRAAAPKRPAGDRFAANSFRTPWNPGQPSASGSAKAQGQDEWESGQARKEEWDDWEDDQEPARGSAAPQAEIRDRADEDWAEWDGYEEGTPRRERFRWSDRRDSVGRDSAGRTDPVRTDFEAKQEPVTRQQTGSIYSFSYNKPEPVDSDIDSGSRDSSFRDSGDRANDRADGIADSVRPGGVYDADYRVITPPYRPDPETPPVETEDDWGLEEFERDDLSSDGERRRPGP